MPKFDTYEEVTSAIVTRLEEGTMPWRQGWDGGLQLQMPHRVTGQAYRGINVLLLWIAAEERKLSGRHWMTFKQALELGGAVRKGEKGTRIVFFKQLDITDENDAGEEVERRVPMLRSYTVFNASQIDGLPDKYQAPTFKPAGVMADKARDEAAEAAMRSCGANIREFGTEAYYERITDRVTLPGFDRFHTTGDFLATMAHELCHWTGHKSRLDRLGDVKRFGSPEYAFEELVAELGAAFIGARMGITGQHIDNHAAYIANWLKGLRNDKRAIFRAASAAQTAADLVLARAAQTEATQPERALAA